jgi:hypothetical protein
VIDCELVRANLGKMGGDVFFAHAQSDRSVYTFTTSTNFIFALGIIFYYLLQIYSLPK